jgi:hypothetical protein
MQNDSLHRRRFLAAAGATLTAAVAGCSTLPGDDTPEELQFEELHQTPTYVADGADLSLPEEVPTVEATANADLLVLPGDPAVDAEQAVEWLADGRAVSLLGDDAESTWLAWAQSEAFTDTFENEGYADSEPDPDLLVGAAIGNVVTRFGKTWADGPRNRDLLRALDETLVEIEARTPT